MLAAFDSGADAERAATELQRSGLSTLIAGPEQPPATDGWFITHALEHNSGAWWLHEEDGPPRKLAPAQLRAITVVDWQEDGALTDRAVLLRTGDGASPMFLRATVLAGGSTPEPRLKSQLQALDKLLLGLADSTHGARARHRTLGPEDFAGAGLAMDFLPLGLTFVEGLDPTPWSLPGRR